MPRHAPVRPAREGRHRLLGGLIGPQRSGEAESRRYFAASLDLLWAADLTGRFMHVNPVWERVLGHSLTTMRAWRIFDLVHPEDMERTTAEVLALADGVRESAGFSNRCRTAEGEYVWLQWSAHACVADGVIRGIAYHVSSRPKVERLGYEVRRLEGVVAEQARDLAEAQAETLQLLAAAEYRDERTARHCERVGVIAAQIAVRLGLSAESVDLIRRAAPLHDIGKLAIPDRVLLKGADLDAEERSIMEMHADLGARLLFGSRSPVLQLAGVIAASHHERWDGKGFPKGLVGADIPLAGRVVAVADVLDLVTHERPQGSACSVDRAGALVQGSAGSRFDPGVVEACLEMLDVDLRPYELM